MGWDFLKPERPPKILPDDGRSDLDARERLRQELADDVDASCIIVLSLSDGRPYKAIPAWEYADAYKEGA